MKKLCALGAIATWVFVGCSSGTASSSGTAMSSSAHCEEVAQSIRDAAAKPRLPNYPNGYDGDGDGKPDAKGICNSTDPTIMKDFGNACAELKACGGTT